MAMDRTAGAEPDPGIGVLYASQDAEKLDDGAAVFTVRSEFGDESLRGMLCAVLDFPALQEFPDRAFGVEILRRLCRFVKEGFLQASNPGPAALEAQLEDLHLFVQFLNSESLKENPIQGAVTLAEAKGSMLYTAYTSGTLQIVAKYGEADVFPTREPHWGFRIGAPVPPDLRQYQARLNSRGLFFLGTDAWYSFRDSGVAQNILRRDLAQAVFTAIDDDGNLNVGPIERRNTEGSKPGLLLGYPPIESVSDEEEQVAFVAPPEPRLGLQQSSEDSVSEAAGPVGASAGVQYSEETEDLAEDSLLMHSALDAQDDAGGRAAKALGRVAARTGASLTRWFSEVFPDELPDNAAEDGAGQESPPTRGGVPPRPDPPTTGAEGGMAEGTPGEAAPRPIGLGVRTAVERYQETVDSSRSRERKPRSWASMTLLLLLVVIPVSTWIAYSVQGTATADDAGPVEISARRRLETAKALLLREETSQAQEELQAARNLIQAHRDQNGLTPVSKLLESELNALWREAYRVVPLIGLTDPLVTFDKELEPAKVVVNIQNIFLLLEGRNSVVVKHRLDLLTQEQEDQRQTILREGDLVEGVRVGRVVDMAFQPEKTAHSDKPSLYILDDLRNVFQYNDTDQLSVVDLGQKDTWDTPLLIDFYTNRMYVADGGLGQVWRYNLNSPNVQEEGWFSDPMDLSQAMRMHVDTEIWFLMHNNSVVVFGSDGDTVNPVNVQKPFALHQAIGLDSSLVDLETESGSSSVLLLPDPGQAAVLAFDKETGDFLYQLTAPDELGSKFSDLRDVHVHRETLYLLTSDSLYHHSFAP